MRMAFAFYGDVQLDRELVRFSDRVGDARPAWEAMARSFREVQARQFNSEGSFGSGGWAPLSPAYAAWKAKRYPGKPILVRTGALKESLTRRPFGVEELEEQFMVIGSDVEYGAYHQSGGGNLPRRRPVELRESTRRHWVTILQRHLVSGDSG